MWELYWREDSENWKVLILTSVFPDRENSKRSPGWWKAVTRSKSYTNQGSDCNSLLCCNEDLYSFISIIRKLWERWLCACVDSVRCCPIKGSFYHSPAQLHASTSRFALTQCDCCITRCVPKLFLLLAVSPPERWEQQTAIIYIPRLPPGWLVTTSEAGAGGSAQSGGRELDSLTDFNFSN